ncbi:MAG: HD domain-containing protein [Candidatus Aminicenantes bacterium]|nr:HD domain-containing protein [Candidatus Aminicenantes bacterium]
MNLFEKPPAKTRFINTLQNDDKVTWYYRVQEVVKKKTKNGDDFLDLTVIDKTGRMPAKIWNNVDGYAKLIQAGEIYRISGEIREYKGKKQITVTHMQAPAAGDKEFDPADYCEAPPFDSAALLEQMFALLAANLTNPHLRQLVEFFKEDYGPSLQQAYGAQKIHHAFAGGLLQHTYSLLEMILALAPHYGLDKELLLIGALFHDIGKTAEFKTQPALETTLEGGLLGHVIISLTIFMNLKNRIADFPLALATHIEHLIVSHHGEKEYGSPEVPKTPEAYLLHILDLLDSRLNIFREQLKSADGQKLFSEFNQALGTRILLAKQ